MMRAHELSLRFWIAALVAIVSLVASTIPATAEVVAQAEYVTEIGGGIDGQSAVLDDTGASYITARYGNGLVIDGESLASGSGSLLARYTPEGALDWIIPLVPDSPSGSYVWVDEVVADSGHGVFIAGFFSGTFKIGGEEVVTDQIAYFLASFTVDGNLSWVTVDGDGPAFDQRVTGLTLDSDGNVYLSANMGGFVSIEGGDPVNLGPMGIVVAKYSPAGVRDWVRTIDTGTRILSLFPHMATQGDGTSLLAIGHVGPPLPEFFGDGGDGSEDTSRLSVVRIGPDGTMDLLSTAATPTGVGGEPTGFVMPKDAVVSHDGRLYVSGDLVASLTFDDGTVVGEAGSTQELAFVLRFNPSGSPDGHWMMQEHRVGVADLGLLPDGRVAVDFQVTNGDVTFETTSGPQTISNDAGESIYNRGYAVGKFDSDFRLASVDAYAHVPAESAMAGAYAFGDNEVHAWTNNSGYSGQEQVLLGDSVFDFTLESQLVIARVSWSEITVDPPPSDSDSGGSTGGGTDTAPDNDQDAGSTFPFEDVDEANPHAENIQRIVDLGIAKGTSASTFSPDAPVSRGQMATFLAQALNLDPYEFHPFEDVTAANVHSGNIGAVVRADIAVGRTETTFEPWTDVTRAQMATFLRRAAGLSAVDGSGYDDVDPSNVHSGSIYAIRDVGFTEGVTATRYDPSGVVRRDQMATFLVRLIDYLGSE